MKSVQFSDEKRYIKDFLKLPKKIYSKEDNMEDSKEIEKILIGKHILLKYVDKLYKFVVYDDSNIVVARYVITTYKNERETCYLGFYECVDDEKVSKYTFESATEYAISLGFKNIVGPVDLGMWHKYRLKIDHFETRPYTGEPYNKEYYYKQFLDNGFEVTDKYVSDSYGKLKEAYSIERLKKRYDYFVSQGYEFRSPTLESWEKDIVDVYELIMILYSGFNTFIKLDKEDFVEIFDSYKKILDFDVVKLACYEGKTVGFAIGIPNFSNRVYHLSNLKNLFDILKIKNHAKEYIVTYMGVLPEHRGLGRALTQSLLVEMSKKDASFVGALIHEGTATSNLVKEVLKFKYNYVLMKKIL